MRSEKKQPQKMGQPANVEALIRQYAIRHQNGQHAQVSLNTAIGLVVDQLAAETHRLTTAYPDLPGIGSSVHNYSAITSYLQYLQSFAPE